MNETDKGKFSELLRASYEVCGRRFEMSATVARVWWEKLAVFDFSLVKRAFDRHSDVSKFPPTPADILEHLPDPYGHPSPEEAFNATPMSEHDAGYVTDEMMLARGSAEAAIDRGDMVAARMAYIENYKKAVSASKAQGMKARFWYSGSSFGTYEQRLENKQTQTLKAAELGWITPQSALKRLDAICSESGKDLKVVTERLYQITGQNLSLIENGSNKTRQGLNRSSEGSNLTNKTLLECERDRIKAAKQAKMG